MRDPDALDYGLVGTVTVLAYLHLPFRPALRRALRRAAAAVASVLGSLATWAGEEPTAAVGVGVVAVALVGALFAFGVVRSAA